MQIVSNILYFCT